MLTDILVLGVTGNVGQRVVQVLQSIEMPFRIGARNVDRTRQLLGDDLTIVHFDFLDQTTYTQTFTGISRMFMVRPPALSNVQTEIAPAIHAAVEASVPKHHAPKRDR